MTDTELLLAILAFIWQILSFLLLFVAGVTWLVMLYVIGGSLVNRAKHKKRVTKSSRNT